MLKKLTGVLLGLVLAASGVALLGGWLDPAALAQDTASAPSRLFAPAVTWLTDNLGRMGGGAALAVVGLLVLCLAIRGGKSGKGKQKPK